MARLIVPLHRDTLPWPPEGGRYIGMRLVLAFKDKIGKGAQGTRIFRVAGTVDTGFGAASVIVSKVARAIQCPGIAHQGHQLLRLNRMKLLLFQDTSDHVPCFTV